MPEIKSHLAPYTDRLRVRVCGICLKEDHILLVRHGQTLHNKAFWAPPGGGLHYGESVHAGLQREMKEETGLEITVGHLLFVNEFLQPPLHAIELFFEVTVTGGSLSTGIDPEVTADRQLIEQVQWLSLQQVQAIPASDKHHILGNLQSLQALLSLPHNFID